MLLPDRYTYRYDNPKVSNNLVTWQVYCLPTRYVFTYSLFSSYSPPFFLRPLLSTSRTVSTHNTVSVLFIISPVRVCVYSPVNWYRFCNFLPVNRLSSWDRLCCSCHNETRPRLGGRFYMVRNLGLCVFKCHVNTVVPRLTIIIGPTKTIVNWNYCKSIIGYWPKLGPCDINISLI
jgi:hypothetical protein